MLFICFTFLTGHTNLPSPFHLKLKIEISMMVKSKIAIFNRRRKANSNGNYGLKAYIFGNYLYWVLYDGSLFIVDEILFVYKSLTPFSVKYEGENKLMVYIFSPRIDLPTLKVSPNIEWLFVQIK